MPSSNPPRIVRGNVVGKHFRALSVDMNPPIDTIGTAKIQKIGYIEFCMILGGMCPSGIPNYMLGKDMVLSPLQSYARQQAVGIKSIEPSLGKVCPLRRAWYGVS